MALGPRKILRLIPVLLIGPLFIALIGIGQTSPGTSAGKPTASDKSKAKDTKRLYKQNCVKCHGADGAGDTAFGEIVGAADFTDADWQKKVDDQRLINSMLYGRGQMPSFGKKLTKEQITSLLAYVRSFKR